MTNYIGTSFEFSGDKLELLDLLLAEEGLAETAVPIISLRPKTDDPLPLSFAQQRLWFLGELTPGSPLFNTPMALRLNGQLNEPVLAQACQALVQRHESLRTTFTAVSGTPQQIIHDSWPIVLHQEVVAAEDVEIVLQTAVQQPFDLEKGPLLRFHLLRLSETEHILLFVFHHIIFDGWSAGIVLHELTTFYDAFCHDQQPDLPNLPIQYADFAQWQRNWLTGDRLQTQLDYWQANLAGDLPILQLPTDKLRPVVKTHHGAIEAVSLPPQLTAQITALCQQTGTTPFMLLLAAFKVLLYRYTAQKDILVGSPIANRQQAELEGLVGFFVNTLVLRSQLDGEQTFRKLLAQVRQTATTAYDHQDVPFEKLVEVLQPTRNLSTDPLFQVMFDYEDGDVGQRPLPDLTFTPIDLNNGIAQFDLTLAVSKDNDQFYSSLNYNTDLFMPETVRRMLGHWQILLAGIAANPDETIGRLPLLTPAEIQQIVFDWNQTEALLPPTELVHELIAKQAINNPNAVALIYEQQQMSYGELNGRSNQLAHALQAKGIGPESKVGIFINRSLEMVTAALAVGKAGGAYVPLDPAYPLDRLAYMVADSGMTMILTTGSLLPKLVSIKTNLREVFDTANLVAGTSRRFYWGETAVLCLDRDWDGQIAHHPSTNPVSRVTVENLAYIIYTSGSSGKPKGVLVSHDALIRHCTTIEAYYELTPQDKVLQFSSFSFDASLEQLLPPLMSGAQVVLRSLEVPAVSLFCQQMVDMNLTVVNLPTAYWHQLTQSWDAVAAWLAHGQLRLLIVGGEAMSSEHLQYWRAAGLRDVRLLNAYGPTETTITALIFDVSSLSASIQLDRVPIGRPLDGRHIYILDKRGQPVPVGVSGELHIGGTCVAQGYLNRPKLTAEKFIPDPFSNSGGERLYKTGDLGRYLPDGNVEFMGRNDHQVKIRGFRIEMGEIEAALRQHTAVQDVLLLAKDNDGDSQLLAYVVGDEEELGDLRPFLAQSLPAYMIPARFVPLESFPLTPNGKIDRKALPAANGQFNGIASKTFVVPQDALESQLTQIWQEILKLPTISTDANYFEIGGHSLQAVTLFAAIEKKLQVRLPLSLLFQAPTIAQLAAAIRQQGQMPKWSSLVPIQPLGAKTPFFCVHGGAGHVFHYYDLAQQLGTERPFYGLQPVMDEITHQSIYHRVEEMAAQYIQEIKMVQPNGPYLLGGFCFGGIVAYEMAQQLTKAGNEVGLLVFIDPSTPQNKPEPEISELLTARLLRHQKNMAQLSRLARLGYILNSGRNRLVAFLFLLYRSWLRDWRKSRAKLLQKYIDWRPSVPSRFHDFYFMHVISSPATQLYHPCRYAGEAVLFCSTLDNGGDDSLGWADLPQSGLKLYAVASTHLGILKRPFIDQVADKLSQHLEPFA
jgi:amino acid adenylation domain-containing protein